MIVLTALASLVAMAGPFALAGGPIGMGIAWLGSRAANGTVRLIAIGLGLLILVGLSVGITIRIQHLEQKAAAYDELAASNASLERKYGCPSRAEHERPLAACLTAREAAAERARADEVERLRRSEAQARADLAAANDRLSQQERDTAAFIDAAAVKGDGPLPQVLLDMWKRERLQRGLK